MGKVQWNDSSFADLQQKAGWFDAILENAPVNIYLKSLDGTYLWVNRRYAEFFGGNPEDFDGKRNVDYVSGDIVAHSREHDLRVVSTGKPQTQEEEIAGRIFRVLKCPIFDSDGRVVAVVGFDTDITELRRAELSLREHSDHLERAIAIRTAELRRSEVQYRELIEQSILGAYVATMDGNVLFANPKAAQIYGYNSVHELVDIDHVDELVAPEDRERARGYRRARREGRAAPEIYERRGLRKNGEIVWLEMSISVIRWHEVPAVLATVIDITERKRTEHALRESEMRFRTLFEHAPEAMTILDADSGLYFDANPMALKLHGLSRTAIVGKPWLSELSPEYQPDGRRSRDAGREYIARALGGEFPRFEWRQLTPGGCESICEVSLARLPYPDRNLVCANISDITERKAAEAQRIELETKLAQVQKLDAIGQLTAGVAHDFNNLLAVILGNVELLANRVGRDDDAIAPIVRAANQGAELTRRLLAFSRKQVLNPEVLDLSELLSSVTDLLKRTLGEHIEIKTTSDDHLWPIECDRAQLENAVINLALNARDAMPDGGRLTLRATNFKSMPGSGDARGEIIPGQYVALEVIDTGAGIPPEIAEHVFEPFFTTKDVGVGSGLGLSMIYGFVNQSGGHVTLTSIPGTGSTFRLYLPRSTADAATVRETPVTAIPDATGETVLVVEDDPDLRAVVVTILTDFGYRVLHADNGPNALRKSEAIPQLDLLLTDIVLPGGMNGWDLANQMIKRFPDLRVLHMSGYSEPATLQQNPMGIGDEVLKKPFDGATLARKVRQMLALSATQ